MPFTRAQATTLLNQAETGLFDDSRANALRQLRASDLDRRIERARKARDRAGDLLQRQKSASRTGSKRATDAAAQQRGKRKAELLAEILKRFETQLKSTRQREKRENARPVAKKRAAPRKAATGTASKAVSPRKSATNKPSAKKSMDVPSAARTSTTRRPAKTAAAKPPRKITPKQALANTRKLLQAKQAHDRQAQPWQTLDPQHDHLPQAGYQSAEAADKAQELHAGESRMTSIHGSVSTRDRKNQGKRDHRQDSE